MKKPYDILWPLNERSAEDIDANFEVVFSHLEDVSSSQAGVTAVVRGGTGKAAWQTGDLLVAEGPQVIGAITAVAVGEVLLSQGVKKKPAFGKVDLQAHVTNVLQIVHGGTSASAKTTAFNNLSPLSAKGDLIVRDGTGSIRLGVGSDSLVLTADSSSVEGIKWAAIPVQTSVLLSAVHTDTSASAVARGGLIAGIGSSPLWTLLIKGSVGQVLTMGADEPGWATVSPALTTHSVLSTSHPDTSASAAVRGGLIAALGASPLWTQLAKGGSGQVLTMGADEPAWATPSAGVSTHSLLSSVHDDTSASVVVRGDLLAGIGASPLWTRLAKGTSGYFLKMGADEPAWGAHGLSYGDVGAAASGHNHDLTYLGIAATAADSDKLDGQHGAYYAVAGAAPAAHDILSTPHGDSAAAAVVRGDLIVGIGATPKWTRLAKGTSGYVLTMGADEPGWAAAAASGAPVDAQYVVLATNGTLTVERVLTGTANQITVTDNGAGGTVVLSTPQNLHTGATPQFAGLGLGVAAETGAGAAVLKLAGAYYSVPTDDGNSGAAKTIDWSTSNEHKLTLDAVPCTLTFSNPKTGGRYVLELVQDATGSRTVVWPVTVVWNNGIPPALTSTPGGIDLIAFYYDGASYVGAGSGVGGGTVTSVGLSLPALFTVSGSPIVASGTLAAVLATQNANLVFAGPSSGAAAAPTFRQLASTELSDTTNLARLDAVNVFTAAGTHTFSAGIAGGNILSVRNTTNNAAAYSQLLLGNDATAALFVCSALSSTYTPSGTDLSSGCTFKGLGAGGLSIAATDVAGDVRFYGGGTTVGMTLDHHNNLGIGVTPSYVLHVSKAVNGDLIAFFNNTHTAGYGVAVRSAMITTTYILSLQRTNGDSSVTVVFEVYGNGRVLASGLPTSAAGLAAGELWVDTTGGLNIVKRV